MLHRIILIFSCRYKTIFISAFVFFCVAQQAYGQSVLNSDERGSKGMLYFYWGWNLSSYSKSDIHFEGLDYDFTLSDVKATDRQSSFGLDPYFNPAKFTIPQYNFRLGYFFWDNWAISFGIDHMKYVVTNGQEVEVSGYISDAQNEFFGIYDKESKKITSDFLLFEHTDGLNYINLELRRNLPFFDWNMIQINGLIGGGTGLLLPRSNVTLIGKARYDEFHLSGFGFNVVTGLNIRFFKRFFIQSEIKGGYFNMPDIRTSQSKSDSADQEFLFIQYNILFGATFQFIDPKD